MDDSKWNVVKEEYDRLRQLGPEEREQALAELEARDAEVASEVRGLLQALDQRGSLLPDAQTLVPGFELIEELGDGSFGVVHKARDLVLERIVAIKVLKPALAVSASSVEDFLGEARRTSTLDHPSIAKIHSVGAPGATPHFVMQYVEGASLDKLIREAREARERTSEYRLPGALNASGVAPSHVVAELVARVADALQHSHEQGIVHRDIKPSNILVDVEGRPFVVDFGIAKELNRETVGTRAVGTPYYMSPEQARLQRGRVDERSDVYSLGVVLYELLSLRRPFDGDTEEQVYALIEECRPEPVRALNDDVPLDLQTICHKALRKDPARRYASAQEFAADLRRFLAAERPLAQPPGKVELLSDWAQLHRRRIALGLTPVALGLAIWTGRQLVEGASPGVRIELAAIPENVRLSIARIDARTGQPDPEFVVERGTDRAAFVAPPAHYRITLRDGARQGEVDALLFSAGDELQLELPTLAEAPSEAEGMVFVAGGPFDARRHVKNEPEHLVVYPAELQVAPFWIDATEVTNAEYEAFLNAVPSARRPKFWPAGDLEEEWYDLPVTGVTLADAQAYARWAGKRLPTAIEWEYAARGGIGRRFVWGDEALQADELAHLRQPAPESERESWEGPFVEEPSNEEKRQQDWSHYLDRVSAVGQYEGDTTPEGVRDMMGNVQEWVLTPLTDTLRSTPDRLVPDPTHVFLKGSSFDFPLMPLTKRFTHDAAVANSSIGFRCVVSLPSQ